MAIGFDDDLPAPDRGVSKLELVGSVVSEPKLAERRERGMNDMAAVLQALYGDRCTRREGGCTCCAVWAIYDALDTMTDSSVFADDLQKLANK